jgi:hypothetical protein
MTIAEARSAYAWGDVLLSFGALGLKTDLMKRRASNPHARNHFGFQRIATSCAVHRRLGQLEFLVLQVRWYQLPSIFTVGIQNLQIWIGPIRDWIVLQLMH